MDKVTLDQQIGDIPHTKPFTVIEDMDGNFTSPLRCTRYDTMQEFYTGRLYFAQRVQLLSREAAATYIGDDIVARVAAQLAGREVVNLP